MDRLFQDPLPRAGEVVITPWSYQSIGVALATAGQVIGAGAAWPAANVVIFVPFGVPEAVTITKFILGVAVAAGNVDAGIYKPDGTLIVSAGTTAASTSGGAQVIDTADTVLARGLYYMAAVADTVTTLTFAKAAPAAGIAQTLGLLEQASVTLPLSTNASPAVFAKYTRAYVPLIGVQGYRTIGP